MRVEILMHGNELLQGAGRQTFDDIQLIEIDTPCGRFQLQEIDSRLEVMGIDGLVIMPTMGNVILLAGRGAGPGRR